MEVLGHRLLLFFTAGQLTNLSLSNTGQYQLVLRIEGAVPYIYLSQNFGDNISTTPIRTGVFGQTSFSISLSSSGQFMIYAIGGNTIGVSSNFGSSFATNPGSLGSFNWRFSGISSDGLTQILGVSNTGLYKSKNSGTSFSALPITSSNTISTMSYITTKFSRNNATASKQIK